MQAMGVSSELAEATLRVSLGWSCTMDDMQGFLAALDASLHSA